MKELAGATKLFVDEGIPVVDACAAEVEILRGEGLVVEDD
jgi:hypothetical protein